MKQLLINAYAAILESEHAVTFEDGDTIYRIWANDEGWNVNVYEEHQDGDHFYESDGGLCTGTARDAIEFMLPS